MSSVHEPAVNTLSGTLANQGPPSAGNPRQARPVASPDTEGSGAPLGMDPAPCVGRVAGGRSFVSALRE